MGAVVWGQGMATELAVYLQSELDKRGWDAAQLADKADIGRTSLHKILHGQTKRPDIDTTYRIAGALGVSFGQLLTIMGYPVDKSDSADGDQLALLIASVPRLREFMSEIATLPPDELRAIRVYADLIRKQRDD